MTEETKQESGVTAAEARRILDAERERQVQACNAAIQRALQEHGCELVAVARITADGRVAADVQLRVAQ